MYGAHDQLAYWTCVQLAYDTRDQETYLAPRILQTMKNVIPFVSQMNAGGYSQ